MENQKLSFRELLIILTKLEADYNEALNNKKEYTNHSIRNLRMRIKCYKSILKRK